MPKHSTSSEFLWTQMAEIAALRAEVARLTEASHHVDASRHLAEVASLATAKAGFGPVHADRTGAGMNSVRRARKVKLPTR
jgi:hypothetical protein